MTRKNMEFHHAWNIVTGIAYSCIAAPNTCVRSKLGILSRADNFCVIYKYSKNNGRVIVSLMTVEHFWLF